MNPPQENSPSQQGLPQQSAGEQQQAARPALTQEELRALKECSRESFWYRCVPAGVVFVGTTQLLVSRGFLTPHPRFGALLKNMGAALLAYFLGKLSYQDECRQKILRLENSPLAESMRRGKRGTDIIQELSVPNAASRTPTAYDGGQTKPTQPLRDEYSHNIDTDNNIQHKGLDDSFRPSMDTGRIDELPKQDPGQQYTSYNDLRKKNRETYDQKLFMARPPPPTNAADKPQSPTSHAEDRPKNVRINKYGDVIDE